MARPVEWKPRGVVGTQAVRQQSPVGRFLPEGPLEQLVEHFWTIGWDLQERVTAMAFGQALVPEVIDRAMRAAADADLFLAIGTSLQVYPIAGAVERAYDAGARVVIVNAQPTPFDDVAAALLRDPIGVVLPRICGGLKARPRHQAVQSLQATVAGATACSRIDASPE